MSTLPDQASSILIVDDDDDMRFLATAIFEDTGIAVAGEAHDGPDALRKLDELNPPPVPTVVLLDNQMPGMTGLEVAGHILAERPSQIIVLFSAFLDPAIVAEAERLGVSACVSKGDAMKLPEIVGSLVAGRQPG